MTLPPHRTTSCAMIGTALAVILATAAPAAPATSASEAAPRVETRLLPASAAWSVPVEILETGAVVGNDAAAGTLYGQDDVSLEGNTRPWVWTGRGRRDLDLAGRPSGAVIDVAETGVAVGSVTQAADVGTRTLAVRWNGAGAPSLLLPEITGDTVAQDVNLRGDALADATSPTPPAPSASTRSSWSRRRVSGAPSRRTGSPTPRASTPAARCSTRRTQPAASWAPATGATAWPPRCPRPASVNRCA